MDEAGRDAPGEALKHDDGQIFYPSGNLAISIAPGKSGKIFTFHPDTPKFQVAAFFDCQGVGSINHTNGRPWLVVTLDGWIVSDQEGRMTDFGRFPRKSTEPLLFVVSDSLTFRFLNRQDILASFASGDGSREFQCGQHLKRDRSDTYTNKVVSKTVDGRLKLDIGQIRQRQQAVGSLYVPKGPHHFITPAPGVGILKTLVKTIDASSQVLPTIGDLDALQKRLTTISALRTPAATTQQKQGDMPEDFGSPELSQAQQKLWQRTQPFHAKHTARRKTLRLMSVKQVQAMLTDSKYERDTLYVLCLLADWNRVCFRLEEQLQEVHHTLHHEAAANPSSDAGHMQVYKVDASESSWLQKRYDFRSVPMFFMMYEAKLVAATTKLHNVAQVMAAARTALADARRGVFLPDSFSFDGRDLCSALDSIQPGMSLVSPLNGSG